MTRPVDDAEKRRRGTSKPSRSVVALFPDHASRPDPVDLPPPAHLSAAAKTIWRTKVERYLARGQKTDGFQDALAVYCALEAALNQAHRRGTATSAMMTTYRRYAAEFYDTPKSFGAAPSGGPASAGDNPFSRNGVFPK